MGYVSVLLAIGLYICWTQFQAGCNFSLGSCYGKDLSVEHETLRVGFILLSEISWVAIGGRILLLAIRRARNKSTH